MEAKQPFADLDPPRTTPTPSPGTPGKRSLTQGLAPRTIVYRDAAPTAAGPRDANGVAADAEAAVARAASGSGAPLPTQVRRQFEGALGADLSGVRVHTGGASAEAAQAVGAKAYTVGDDIHFAAGRYQPDDPFGLHLLAHEVAHTVQQSGGAPRRQHKLEVSTPHDAAEHEADRAADAMVRGETATVTGATGGVVRDFDSEMVAAGRANTRNEGEGDHVKVINIHTTIADQSEAQAALAKIDGAEAAVAAHKTDLYRTDGGGSGPMSSMLVENHQARFVLEQYLASVSDSGNFQSQFAASYMTTRQDYGEFMGLWATFEANGGKLADDASKSKMAAMSSNPEFLRARTKFESVRDSLQTDKKTIATAQIDTASASAGLLGAVQEARAAAAKATANKKKAELARLMASITAVVDTIMTVGQIAATATSGLLAIGSSGGLDMGKMIESSNTIDPGNPMAGPDLRAFCVPGSDLNPHHADDPSHSMAPLDTRTYAMPNQTMATARDLGGKAVGALGGPQAMLTKAVTMLEQSNIDKLQAQIDAANEDANLAAAASAVAKIQEKRLNYQKALTTLLNNVGNLLDHKKQVDTAVNDMVAAAKKQGAGKDLTGAIRLVGSGDKFLSQIDLTISLGQAQQQKGAEAKMQRYNINQEAFSTGHAQGPGQLRYWTVAKSDGDWVGTRHLVELRAVGKDSLVSGNGANSTQFDTGKAIEELSHWKVDVTEKRDRAERALALGNAAGQSR
ncbi:MAG: DUF4157 domain-containing protein [Myxococcales bacterium]|nr:DUF4157 domain-containing protein [Myxococcales bacterium]